MSESHQREAAIFDAAMELPPGQRAAHLDHACGGDAALRQRLEALLKAGDSACEFLESPTDPSAAETLNVLPSFEKAGDRIGRYKLLQQIGEGGCGVVYMAEQEEPVSRRVALKVIKLGLDTKSVIARFEAERQALALMDHPNIARVLDAGATETGRPYFVMELVRGLKITEYCDEARLSTNARLDLFIQVCQAIQHAHQKGIIHRDIKPSNILVTINDGVPVPKVIDFGIAKATGGLKLTNKTIFTAFDQFIGTPAYMSPEQAVLTSLDIDTRSDIYALGVLLYELLTGKTPFDAKELLAIGLDEMRRTIREQEPPRPSTRLSTLSDKEQSTTAQRRGIDAPKLVSELRGDLDWIVMKALEKDRARRYETANGLAMDIQRHLMNEPVVARPPSATYRFQKLVRRNKLAFAAGAAVFASLLVGLGLSTWLFFQERVAKREQGRLRAEAQAKEQIAQAEAAKSEQVAQFLKELLKGLGPSVAWGGDRTLLQEMLKQTGERIGRGLTNQPDIAISLRLSLAETYEELGLYDAEAEIAEQTLLFARSTFGEESLPAANALAQLGWAEWRLNKLDQAEKHLRESLTTRRKLLGSEHALVADSLGKLCFVLANQKKPVESETVAREALALRQKLLGDDHPDVARSLAALATALRMAGRFDEAEPYAREAVTQHRKLLGNGHYDTTTALNKLALVLMGQRKFAEAEDLMRESLATQKKLLGEKHPELVLSLDVLGRILSARKQDEAEAVHREALAQQRKLHGDEHPDVALALIKLAIVLLDQRKLPEAEATFREALALNRKLHGDDHANVAWSLYNLAIVLSDQGKLAEAETLDREALALRRKLHGNEHLDVANSLNNLASALARQNKFAEAETLYREALALNRKLLGDEHLDVANSLNNLANVLGSRNKLAAAEAMHREALALRKKLLGVEHPDVAQSLDRLATVLSSQGKLDQALLLFEETLKLRKARLGPDHPDTLNSMNNLANAYLEAGKLDQAVPLHEETLKLRKAKLGPDHRETLGSMCNLALVYRDAGKLDQALPLFEETLKLMKTKLAADDPYTRIAMNNLVSAYEAAGKLDQAEQLFNDALTAPIQNQAPSAGLLRSRGHLRARRGQWKEAAADLSRVRGINPDDHERWHELAALLVASGQLDAYREHCRKSAERFGNSAAPLIAERIAKDCLILPASGADLDVVAKMADTAVGAAVTNHWAAPWFALVKGLAEYRQGRFPGAVEWMNKTLVKAGESAERDVEGHMVLAMAHYQLKQTAEARTAFARGAEIERTKLPKLESGNIGGGWLDWIIAHALMREAQALLGAVLKDADYTRALKAVRLEKLEALRAAADRGDVPAMNELAWLQATSTDPALRDGASAVRFAEKAVAKTERKNPGILDTLAAAYTEAGEFAKAVSAQREAIALLHDEVMKKDFESRLKLYESNTPYREP